MEMNKNVTDINNRIIENSKAIQFSRSSSREKVISKSSSKEKTWKNIIEEINQKVKEIKKKMNVLNKKIKELNRNNEGNP